MSTPAMRAITRWQECCAGIASKRGKQNRVEASTMRKDQLGLVVGAVLLGTAVWVSHPALAGQTGTSARAAAKRPDLGGIWQAANEANWDLEGHAAQPGPYPQLLGAWGAVP